MLGKDEVGLIKLVQFLNFQFQGDLGAERITYP